MNREVRLTGLAVRIAGYAVGNYLGVIIVYAMITDLTFSFHNREIK